jgi:hypothetical protein
MDKVTLVANCELAYGGGHYGVGMQFVANAADAAELVKAQKASEVPRAAPATSKATPLPRIEPDKP